ncbi:hypothetical protein CIK88_03715 [Prevotella sp. P5-50]|nr:hypothetical protein CIK88_03715 [Prevotella sp. P5-50]
MGCYPYGVQSYELFFNITQKSVILFIHGGQSSDHRNLSTEHTEGTDRRKLSTELFWKLLRKKSLGEIFFKNGLWPEIYSIQLYWKSKSLNKIFDYNALFLRVLPWARETIGLSARFCLCIKIFRRILTENAQQYVALLEGFYRGSPYRLDILTIILKKIFN